MTIRIAAIEVSHWHAVYDAAYLRHLIAMPDVELIAIQDSDANVASTLRSICLTERKPSKPSDVLAMSRMSSSPPISSARPGRRWSRRIRRCSSI